MGENADLVLEGILCSMCGEFINDEPLGHPDFCDGCMEMQEDWEEI